MVTKILVDANEFFEGVDTNLKEKMKYDNLLVGIACKLINYRLDNNLNQKDLAKKLGISQAMVSKLESGEYNPTIKLLHELSVKLGWNLEINFDINEQAVTYECETIMCRETKTNSCLDRAYESLVLAS